MKSRVNTADETGLRRECLGVDYYGIDANGLSKTLTIRFLARLEPGELIHNSLK